VDSSGGRSRAATTTGIESPPWVLSAATACSTASALTTLTFRGCFAFKCAATREGSRGPRLRVPRDSLFEGFEHLGQVREVVNRGVRTSLRDVLRIAVAVERGDGFRSGGTACDDVHRTVADHDARLRRHMERASAE